MKRLLLIFTIIASSTLATPFFKEKGYILMHPDLATQKWGIAEALADDLKKAKLSTTNDEVTDASVPCQCCYKDDEQVIVVDKDAMDCTCENPEAIAARNKELQKVVSELAIYRDPANFIEMLTDNPDIIPLMRWNYNARVLLAYKHYQQCKELERRIKDCAHCNDDAEQVIRLRKDYEETENRCGQLSAFFDEVFKDPNFRNSTSKEN